MQFAVLNLVINFLQHQLGFQERNGLEQEKFILQYYNSCLSTDVVSYIKSNRYQALMRIALSVL